VKSTGENAMLKPESILEIPDETKKIARKAFPKGNTYLKLRDELGPIFDDDLFKDLYPDLGQPAESPARLALVTIMQYMENLPDRQAAEAVRSRIDWK
jgi:transposase